MGRYYHGAFFRDIHDQKKLHIRADDVTWTDRLAATCHKA
jgi:hypothetical protein